MIDQSSTRLCLVGPMVGRNPGRVTTQGEKLEELFSNAGYRVIAVSSAPNRYVRLADIATTIVRRRNEIDVMIVFTYGFASFVVEDVATTLASLWGIPIVLSLCGGGLPEFIERFPRWTSRVFRRAARIVCQSEYLARVMRSLGHAPDVIHNVIDVASYPHRTRRSVQPRMFWMRAFEDLYNPEMPLRVLARVRARHPAATLVMAGQDSGLREAIERRARELGLEAAVRFPGFLDLAGKQREAELADIFINTPRIDNRPICVVEAAAFGLPIVSTRVGGIPDLISDGETGLLVAEDDDAAMADAVLRLVDDPALATRLSENARAIALRSSGDEALAHWDSLLSSVHAQGGH